MKKDELLMLILGLDSANDRITTLQLALNYNNMCIILCREEPICSYAQCIIALDCRVTLIAQKCGFVQSGLKNLCFLF